MSWWRETGGEGGIRTHGCASTTTVFETARINHSRTSPHKNGALGGNRTPYALLRTEALCPMSYEGARTTNGALGGIRTPDLKVRNLSLYPLSYSRIKRTDIIAGMGGGVNRRCPVSVPLSCNPGREPVWVAY